MPEYTDEELELQDEQTEQLDPAIREELRKSRSRAREAAEWKQRAETAERKNVLLDLGIDQAAPLGKLFVRGYEGDWTPEAVRTAAEEIPGLLPERQSSGANELSADEIAALQRQGQASTTTGQGGPDLRSRFEADVRAAKSAEQIMEIVDSADPTLGVIRKGFQ